MLTWIKKHYHWIIAGIVLLEMSIYVGFLNNLASLHLVPVTQDLNVSRSSVSLAFSARNLVGFFATMTSGAMFMKHGYRKLLLWGMLLGSGAYFLMSASQSVWLLAAASMIMGLLDYVCSTAGATKIISAWFYQYRGTVLGLVTAATGIGGSLFCLVLNRIIEGYGWRASYGFCGVLVLALGILMFLIIRNRPSDLGLKPLGLGHTPKKKPRNSASESHWLGLSFPEMLRRPSFYLMIFGTFTSCFCMYTAFNVFAPHLTDRGLSSSQAATMQSLLFLVMALAKFLTGALSDWIGPRAVTLSCLSASAVSLWLLSGVSDTGSAVAALLFFAWALPATTITVPLLTTALFGYQSSDRAIGIFLAVVTLSSMAATPVANALFDVFGSYGPVFRAGAMVTVGIIVVFVIMYLLAAADKRRFHAGEVMEEETA